jgi:hypothetical protein
MEAHVGVLDPMVLATTGCLMGGRSGIRSSSVSQPEAHTKQ